MKPARHTSRPARPVTSGSAARTPRPPQTRHRFTRSAVGRYRAEQAAEQLASPTFAELWARFAIPGGMTAFWAVFVLTNWDGISLAIQNGMAILAG